MIDHNCKHFQLEAIVVDNHTLKKPEYMLRWEIICSPTEKRRIAGDRAIQSKDNHFSTLGGIEWFPKDGGFIFALNALE